MSDEIGVDKLQSLLAKIDPDVLHELIPVTGGTLTMMFTDIVDSTKTKARMGDDPFFDKVLGRHNELIRNSLRNHNGRELKTIGDAFFAAFSTASDAVACACNIQTQLAETPINIDAEPLAVRIGLHTGAPKVYRDPQSQLIDLSGTDVDKAARIEGLARGGHVLISEETHALGKPKDAYDWGRWELKGLGRHRAFEVLWPGKTPERPAGRAWLEPIRYLTRFCGREAKLDQIMEALSRNRLVTLRGMGGIGKTRLADEIGARVSQRFDDGVFFVELAAIANSESAVLSELIARLKVTVQGFPDERAALLAALQNRQLLLILDNFEVVNSAALLVSRLLRNCPGVHLLATSQQLLGVPGEQQIEVEPMAAPASGSTLESLSAADSYKLFCDRARLKKSGWTLLPEQATQVAEILNLTDGIPLSIELAAAWIDRKTLAELAGGLRQNRARYLKTAPASVEAQRHASIEACIDWSFNLFSNEERSLFAQLSIFTGGFFADDVVQVCNFEAAGEILDALHDRSLLLTDECLGRTRYRMLPTVQEYAKARLGDEAHGLRQAHASHFLAVLNKADDQLRGNETMAGLARIDAYLENIRSGLAIAVRVREQRMIVSYAQAFATYLSIRAKFTERLALDNQAVAAAEALGDKPLWAATQNNLGITYGDLPTGDRGENLKKAIACCEAALRVFTEKDFPLQWAATQHNLGEAYKEMQIGDRRENLKKAIGYYEAALRVRTEKDFPLDWGTTLHDLGDAFKELASDSRGVNLTNAITCFEEAVRGFEAVGYRDRAEELKKLLVSLKQDKQFN